MTRGTYESGVVGLDTHVDLDGEDVSREQYYRFQQFAELFEELFHTFVDKNLDYNSSITRAGEREADADYGPFDDARTANAYKTYTRTEDKRERYASLAFGDRDEHVEETLVETTKDAAVYWTILSWYHEYYSWGETMLPQLCVGGSGHAEPIHNFEIGTDSSRDDPESGDDA